MIENKQITKPTYNIDMRNNKMNRRIFVLGLMSVLVFSFLITPALAEDNKLDQPRSQKFWNFFSNWWSRPSPAAIGDSKDKDQKDKDDKDKKACSRFERNLGVGARGQDVVDLHVALTASGFEFAGDDKNVFGEATAAAVVHFQAKSGIIQTGYVGPLTRARLQVLYPCVTNNNNRPPVIQSVSGPNNLNPGVTGTWVIRATAPAKSSLTYRVDWGDTISAANVLKSNNENDRVSQTATFTHVYNNPGTYTAIFTVTDQTGKSDSSRLNIRVGTSLPNPTMQVLAPTGGNSWAAGSSQTITWQIAGEIPTGAVLQLNLLGSTNVNLKRFAAGEFTRNGSWTITVPSTGCWGDMCDTVRPGEYLIEVALFDRTPCYGGCLLPNPMPQVLAKASSGAIRLTTANQANQPPVISAVSGPTILGLGVTGTWTVSATDLENSALTYTVDWGDSSSVSSASVARSAMFTQSATFTHNYTRAGTFSPVFTVTDSAGLTARTSLSVNVR